MCHHHAPAILQSRQMLVYLMAGLWHWTPTASPTTGTRPHRRRSGRSPQHEAWAAHARKPDSCSAFAVLCAIACCVWVDELCVACGIVQGVTCAAVVVCVCVGGGGGGGSGYCSGCRGAPGGPGDALGLWNVSEES